MGPLRLKVAQSMDETIGMFGKMKKLHQYSWTRRGQSGAFLSEFACKFHDHLIRLAGPQGEIQMVEASAGGTSFGYLYNFVMDGVVYNYQSGFLYESDSRYKPGLVTHALAIQHNVDDGNQIYDLLMGDQRFKRSLAMEEEDMLSLVVRRVRLRLRLEERLHDIWDWVRK